MSFFSNKLKKKEVKKNYLPGLPKKVLCLMIFWCLKNGFPVNNSYILLDGEKLNFV